MPKADTLNGSSGDAREKNSPAQKDGEMHMDREESLSSWWAKHWLRTLAQWLDAQRLAQGKKYLERDYPSRLEVSPGSVVAQIKGPALDPVQIHIEIDTFDDQEWEQALDAMFQQAGYAAQLLNGEMPPDIEVVFRSIGLALFPGTRRDLHAHCSCGSPIVPCEHVAGVYHLLAQRLGKDPFLLFRMRGRTREQILAGFRARRASRSQYERDRQGYEGQGGADVANVSLPSDSHTFWRIGPQIENVEIDVGPPDIHMEVLKLLGAPAFANEETVQKSLVEIYQRVSHKALEIAYGEREPEGEERQGSDGHSG
ncbi:MAG: hypothetical protein U9R48_05035 [Chloroflexota bacterium]|nr:hypothetical protein [Chloroflexota bacterium]